MQRNRSRVLSRVVAVTLGLFLALVGLEILFRVKTPRFAILGAERVAFSEALEIGTGRTLELDEDLGFRQVAGGTAYDVHGALRNDYLLGKPATSERLLFIGDSVTRRGRLVSALCGALGGGGGTSSAGTPVSRLTRRDRRCCTTSGTWRASTRTT